MVIDTLYFIVSPTADAVVYSAPAKTAQQCWANYDQARHHLMGTGVDSKALRKRGYRARRLLLVSVP